MADRGTTPQGHPAQKKIPIEISATRKSGGHASEMANHLPYALMEVHCARDAYRQVACLNSRSI